ncbi:MAG: amidophosphoribosyltransferase [Anaerolineales bacterium]|nr:MAG: amidophosphoribosyltransferase [Anaerolineales bacterium]
MGGVFGVVAKDDCVLDLFYGVDYHSHLGTRRGGLAVLNGEGFTRYIHSIENVQFRSRFEEDVAKMSGRMGIGCISDTESQPLIIRSHVGDYAVTTVGRINNVTELARQALGAGTHFSETSGGEISPTELVATLINQGKTLVDGIKRVQQAVDGSCSLLVLTADGLYAARDRLGRTPLIVGEKDGAYCAGLESCALPNLDYRMKHELGPGEIVLITPEGMEQKAKPGKELRICSFLWVYYGYPPSTYEGVNVEVMRNRSGAALARADDVEVDLVAGIPDSGTAHAIGYANEARIPYRRPFVKYTPTWPRSFTPYHQETRNLVARMKLIPVRELIDGRRLLFCEDSIVRGTQLQETVQRLYDHGAKEVHMRPACPPLVRGCKFLNFTRSRSELELAGRRAIGEIEGRDDASLDQYSDADTAKYAAMVDRIRERLGFTSLRYQRIGDMVEAISLPKERLCTHCWDGVG